MRRGEFHDTAPWGHGIWDECASPEWDVFDRCKEHLESRSSRLLFSTIVILEANSDS